MDKLANFIVSLKNSNMVGKEKIFFPYSALINNIAELLKQEGYIKTFRLVENADAKTAARFMEVILNYKEDGKPAIKEVKRVSKSSMRVYSGTKKLPTHKRGLGLVVMTTPKGIMTAKAAKKEHVGGEVLFKMF